MENKELWGVGRTWLAFALLNAMVFALTVTKIVPPETFMDFATMTFITVVGGKSLVAGAGKFAKPKETG